MLSIARSIVLGLALVGATASAQSVDPRLVKRLDAGTRSAVAAIIDSARVLRLPTEPLIDKALEGAAKKGSESADRDSGSCVHGSARAGAQRSGPVEP